MWGINMTNTRILWALCHPTCSDVVPVSPLSLRRPKTWLRDGPLRQPIGRQDGGGGSGKSVYVEWRRYKSVLAVTLQGWGGSTRCTIGGFNVSNLMGITRYWQKNNFLLFAKCLKMYSFFRICILRLQKVLLWPKKMFSWKISIWVSKRRRILCWFQICWCRLS